MRLMWTLCLYKLHYGCELDWNPSASRHSIYEFIAKTSVPAIYSWGIAVWSKVGNLTISPFSKEISWARLHCLVANLHCNMNAIPTLSFNSLWISPEAKFLSNPTSITTITIGYLAKLNILHALHSDIVRPILFFLFIKFKFIFIHLTLQSDCFYFHFLLFFIIYQDCS